MVPILSVIIQREYSKYTNNSSYGEDTNTATLIPRVRKTTKNAKFHVSFSLVIKWITRERKRKQLSLSEQTIGHTPKSVAVVFRLNEIINSLINQSWGTDIKDGDKQVMHAQRENHKNKN